MLEDKKQYSSYANLRSKDDGASGREATGGYWGSQGQQSEAVLQQPHVN